MSLPASINPHGILPIFAGSPHYSVSSKVINKKQWTWPRIEANDRYICDNLHIYSIYSRYISPSSGLLGGPAVTPLNI